MKSEVIVFENDEVKLNVNVQEETVWLSQSQMAQLFGRDKSVIFRHIKKALEEELDNSVVANFATTAKDGKTYQVDYYNLDMIISVGYRVKSKNGIIFRKWANKILKDYLIKGYVVNQKRLEYLEKTIKLIDIAGRIDIELESSETKQITYDDCMKIIGELKTNSASPLFALERNQGLKAIIGNIYSSFDGKDLYLTIEEKAANFLYLVTKDHNFIDGNKRIAATLFIYFLEFYNLLYTENGQIIDNNTLVAVTLLIVQSNPKEKDILIDLVMNFLTHDQYY